MQRSSIFHFMTLVVVITSLSFSWSHTTLASVGSETLDLDPKQPSKEPSDKPSENPEVLKSIGVTPAPPVSGSLSSLDDEYFFGYKHSVSFRLGSVYNAEKYRDKKKILSLMGASFMTETTRKTYFEFGFDAISESEGRIHIARKWIYSQTRNRPYLKFGFGVRTVGSQGFATIVEPENWQMRGAAGFEQLIRPPISIRLELEAAVGTKAQDGIASAGVSYAW